MKIKDGYILDRIGEQKIAVSLDAANNNFSGVIKLNSVGAFLWELLSEGTTEEAMVQAVTEKYEIDAETAKKDIQKFVATLEQNKILER